MRVDEAALDEVARQQDDVTGALRTARATFARATGHDVGQVHAAHSAAVERWQAGLATGVAALDEVAAEVRRCAAQYRATDDDASVDFTGIVPR